MKRNIFIVVLTMATMIFTSSCKKDPWQILAKKNLNAFEELNGTAPYVLEDGVLIGTTVVNSPNSFLCTKEKYGDFILEFDTWFDPKMNSGVQIRSESTPDYKNGRVHGYQVELDPSPRAWSGGIYDEARRGWLYSLEKNPEGKKALKVGEWNHYRIEAIGNSIRTWINGIPCADLIDNMTPSGFIAFQVHSIGKDEKRAGLKVMWKNIKILTTELDTYKTPYTPVIPQISYMDNQLTEREKSEGWKLLFDGKTSKGWMNAKTKAFPENGWEIKDGVIMVSPATKKPGGGGDIVTTETFKNFELSFDFMYAKGANSGIKYFINIDKDNGRQASIGCEYQILDNTNHPDAKKGKDSNRTLASLYDLIATKYSRTPGPDQWNRGTIIVRGNKVQHWLNGGLAVEYEKGTKEWNKIVSESKFHKVKGFAETDESHILLQDHGNNVKYKNIKIKELK